MAITVPAEIGNQNRSESSQNPWQINSINHRLKILHDQLRSHINEDQICPPCVAEFRARIKAWENLKNLFHDLNPFSLASKISEMVKTNFSFFLILLNDDHECLIHLLIYTLIITGPNARDQTQLPSLISDPLKNLMNVLAAAKINTPVTPPENRESQNKNTRSRSFTFSPEDINKSNNSPKKVLLFPNWNCFPDRSPTTRVPPIPNDALKLPEKNKAEADTKKGLSI